MQNKLIECVSIMAVKNNTAVSLEFQNIVPGEKQDPGKPVTLVITNMNEQDVKTFITGGVYKVTIEPYLK